MQVKMLIYLLLQTNLVRHNELLLRYTLLSRNVFLSHQVEQIMLRIQLLLQVFLNILVTFVLEIVNQLHPVALKVQSQPLPHQFIQLLIYSTLIHVEVNNRLRPLPINSIPLLQLGQPFSIPLHRHPQVQQRLQQILDRIVISNEKSLIELLVKIFNKMSTTDRRHLERKLLQLHSHSIYLLHRLLTVNKILNLVGNLQSLIEVLTIIRQFDISTQHSTKINRQSIHRSSRNVLKCMPQKTLLLKLLDQSRMHIEIDSRVVPRKINVRFSENLFLDRNRIQDKPQIGMTGKITTVTHKQSPSDLPRKIVKGKIYLLNRRIQSQYHVFLNSLSRVVVDQITRQVQTHQS